MGLSERLTLYLRAGFIVRIDEMSTVNGLTIGKLAKRGGGQHSNRSLLRAPRIIPKPKRSLAGYRLYDEEAIKRLGFVRKAQLLGFSPARNR